MKKKTLLYSLAILLFIGYSQQFSNPYYSGTLYAQDDANTSSQRDIKRQKKKHMRDQAKADKASLKRHRDIQSKATRKRMRQHLRETKKNIKNSHR